MPEHPTPEELQALCEGRIANEEQIRKMSLHLVAGCETCRAALPEPYGSLVPCKPEGVLPLPEEDAAALEQALGQARRVARRRERILQQQRARVGDALALLEAEGPAAVDKARRSLGDLAVFEALSAKSWSLRHEDPPEMLRFAREALKASRQIDPVRFGPRPVADWQARAWAELGNACRVADRLTEARSCFEEAIKLSNLGTRDTSLQIRLLDLQATLAADCGEFRESCLVLTLVHQYHLAGGDSHLAGRALISRGMYTGYAGWWDEAIRLLQEGLGLIDAEREPSLVLAAVHNQLWALVETGRFEAAKKHYFLNSRLFATTGGRVSGLRLVWLRARVYAGLSDPATAEEFFREAKAGFEKVERPYDAALTGLDLAALLLTRQRTPEAKVLLRAAAQTFLDLEVARFDRVVLLLQQTAEMQNVELMHQIVVEVTAFLRRAEYDPNARFEPGRRPPTRT